jgi:hypothetical protein
MASSAVRTTRGSTLSLCRVHVLFINNTIECLVAMATTVNQSTMRNYSKRTRIVAAWLIDPDFDRQRAADALSVSYEYIRQVVTDLESEECEMVEDCVMLE